MRYYSPNAIFKWADLKSNGLSVQIKNTKTCGYMMIFDDYDKCKEEYPDREVLVFESDGENQ